MQGHDRTGRGQWWIVIGVLLGLAVNAAAQGPIGAGGRGPIGPPPGPGGPGAGLPPIFLRIDLTDQQRTQIKAILDEQRESRRAELEERRTLQQQLTAGIYGSGADADALAAIVAKLADLQKQALDADVVLQTKIAALLTDEQRQQIIVLETSRPAPPHRSR
jgi:Spy/CpxP family protein refolding chaperone